VADKNWNTSIDTIKEIREHPHSWLIGSGPKEKAYIQSYRTSVKFKAEKNHKKLFIGTLQRRGTKIDLLGYVRQSSRP
jgi:hypothetical protein